MTGPLAGIGQQQIPLSQPYQPGGAEDNRVARQREEREPRTNEVQASRTSQAAQSRESDSTPARSREKQSFSNSLSASNSNDPAPRRGSVVNLTV